MTGAIEMNQNTFHFEVYCLRDIKCLMKRGKPEQGREWKNEKWPLVIAINIKSYKCAISYNCLIT